MKKTLLLLASCLALTTAVMAQRLNDRDNTDLSEAELRRLSIPDPFDERAALPGSRYDDGYRSQSAYNSPQWSPGRITNRKVYRRAFEDGFRTGYREGFQRVPTRRLPRPLSPAEAGFADGYYRGLRDGQQAFASRYGNGYNNTYGRRDPYNNYPRRY